MNQNDLGAPKLIYGIDASSLKPEPVKDREFRRAEVKMKSVLVVENHAEMQTIFKWVFSRFGFQTYGAHDDQSALKILDRITPNVVIIDINMPQAGISPDLIKQVRANPRWRHVGIIVLTTNAHYQHHDECELADACLMKPVDTARLVALMQKMINCCN